MSTVAFNKRIYTLPTFVAGLRDAFAHRDDIRAAARSGRVSKAFAQKIMLAVTQVNGCRYCDYGHTYAALQAGVTEEELRLLKAGALGEFPDEEAVALLFAQHYAERNGHPDPEAWQRVLDVYGPEMARDIMAYLRMITVGNLLGNTFDALLSRLRGQPALGSSLFHELAVLGSVLAGLALPVGLVLGLFLRLARAAFTRET